MARAQQGIRFIKPNYEEIFRIPDGGRICITQPGGQQNEYICRYVDDSHLEIRDSRDNLFHICQFAEIMERNGNTVEPVGPTLGEQTAAPLTQTMGQTM